MVKQAGELRRLFETLVRESALALDAGGGSGSGLELWEEALRVQSGDFDRYSIETVFGSRLAPGSWIVPDREGRRIDLSLCAAETAASERRTKILASLPVRIGAGKLKVKLWGDEGLGASLREGMEYCGAAGHFVELTRIYNGSRINLDIGRIYQGDIVTMRVFDVLACKGFVLADHSEDLEDLFAPGEDIAVYRSISQIPSLVEHYLTHDVEREEMAERGRQRVLENHTIGKRLESMLQALP
jgi:spore maturation protein CgeB